MSLNLTIAIRYDRSCCLRRIDNLTRARCHAPFAKAMVNIGRISPYRNGIACNMSRIIHTGTWCTHIRISRTRSICVQVGCFYSLNPNAILPIRRRILDKLEIPSLICIKSQQNSAIVSCRTRRRTITIECRIATITIYIRRIVRIHDNRIHSRISSIQNRANTINISSSIRAVVFKRIPSERRSQLIKRQCRSNRLDNHGPRSLKNKRGIKFRTIYKCTLARHNSPLDKMRPRIQRRRQSQLIANSKRIHSCLTINFDGSPTKGHDRNRIIPIFGRIRNRTFKTFLVCGCRYNIKRDLVTCIAIRSLCRTERRIRSIISVCTSKTLWFKLQNKDSRRRSLVMEP